MMRSVVAAAALLTAVAGCDSPATVEAPSAPVVEGAWRIDSQASRIAFTGTQTGKEFTGAFETFDLTVVLDPADLSAARIEAVIDTGSAKTGDRQRDAALPGADWFSTAAFPQARFESESVTASGEGDYEAHGKLSIRGIVKEIAFPFTLTIETGRAVADGQIALNRTDFGLGQGEFLTDKWVGYDVDVTVHIEATR